MNDIFETKRMNELALLRGTLQGRAELEFILLEMWYRYKIY